jgi:Ribbon-helix-helix protein, copG family
MRTTISLDDDIQAAVERMRRVEGIGLSEAVNRLARGGLAAKTRARPNSEPFVQKTARLGLRIDVTSVADALEQLDGPTAS